MNNLFDKRSASQMGKVLLFLGIVTVLYMGMKFVNETKAYSVSGDDVSNVSTIDVTGTGNAFAIPDIASESFTVQNQAASIGDAQGTVTTTVNKAVAFLKSSGIATTDIQTSDYSASPEYTYPTPCMDKNCTNVDTTPKLSGYTVSETITVKIRNTDSVGAIVAGLGSIGVTGLTGPNFTVDDPDTVNAAARAKAIADAQQKAQVLAKQLGVSLVRVVRFSENNGGGFAVPMMAKADSAMGSAAVAPAVPAGQNEYTSNVTITYEIQ